MSTSPTPTLHDLVALMPHAVALGITLQRATPEEVQGSLDWAADRCTVSGMLHGGVLMSLADAVGAICAYLNLPEGANTSTLESKTNFFRAVREGTVHAVKPGASSPDGHLDGTDRWSSSSAAARAAVS